MRSTLPPFLAISLLLAGALARAAGPQAGLVLPPEVAAQPGLAALGSYQQEALRRVLEERGLQIEPSPEGKRVDRILVKNLDVFDDQDGAWIAWTNVFHMTTREHIIAREVLLRPGDAWDWEIAEETRRRLADPLFTSFVAVVPVRALREGEVHVLVVTRDIFSLRLNSEFEYQGDVFSFLHIEPAENNFLGRRKRLSAVFEMDLGRYSVGPAYYDSNIRGSRWQLQSFARALIGRDSEDLEGSQSEVTLSHPLWAFSRRWGAALSASHFVGTIRRFLGRELRPYDDPDTALVEQVPWTYRYRSFNGSGSVTHQRGRAVIQRFSVGHRFSLRRPSVFDEFFVNAPVLEQSFVRDVLPRSERVSAPFVAYSMFTPRFVTFRDVSTFDLPEDVALGPSLSLSASWAVPALGSEVQFVGLAADVGFTAEIGHRGLLKLAASGDSRVMGRDLVDQRYVVSAYFASPRVWGLGRLVVGLVADRLIDNRSIRNLELGGDSGLRGYPIGAFQGKAAARGNVELRTSALKVLFTRLGVALFWDFGHAAPSFDRLDIHHDLGAGFRLLIPQLQPTVIRFDWAFATQGPTAGFPGRFTAGFTQVF